MLLYEVWGYKYFSTISMYEIAVHRTTILCFYGCINCLELDSGSSQKPSSLHMHKGHFVGSQE